jgi:hypothetical protein
LSGNFLLKSVSETVVHGGTTREDKVLDEIFADVDV